ncbi:MAG: tetratricopeptide repeat protein [Alistipes sp.]|nr:tetratricopeptide repeat protein [Alistipes sp.]
MRSFRHILFATILWFAYMASAYAEELSATGHDAISFTVADSLTNTRRHTDAIKFLTIQRDTSAACEIWLDIVARDTAYAPAHYYLSRLDNNERSLHHAYRAFAADSTNKWYTENYATQLVAKRQYTRAIPIFRRLMRLDPKNLQSYHALAILYGTSGMPYSAIAILDTAELRVGYNPYLAEIHQNLLLDTRQYDRAIETGRRRVTEHPYDSHVRTSLALAYDAAGRDSMARATLDEAFMLDSTDISTTTLIADYYFSKGDERRMLDYEEHLFRNANLSVDDKLRRLATHTSNIPFYGKNYLRIGTIIRTLAIDYPNHPKVIETYASHMIAGGEYNLALEYLRRHLEDTTTTAENYITVLQLENYLDKDELLAMDLQDGLQRFPESFALLSFAGFIKTESDDHKGAIDIFLKGLDKASNDNERSDMWGYIGDVYHDMGNDKSAFKAYKKALKYNADNILVLNNYAYFLSLLDHDLDRALEMSARVLELEADNATYIDTYAWILHRLGRNEEAKSFMRQALSLSGQRDSSLLAHYGDILWALGEKFMAETYWQKAVERGYDNEEMERHIAEITESKSTKK